MNETSKRNANNIHDNKSLLKPPEKYPVILNNIGNTE